MSDSDKILQFQNIIYESYMKKDVATLKLAVKQYSVFLRQVSDTVSKNSLVGAAKLIKMADKYAYIAELLSKEGLSERVCSAIESKGDSDLPKKVNPAPAPATPIRPSVTPTSPIAPSATSGYAAPVVTVVPDPNWSAGMFDKFKPAVATIETETGAGTGFFISSNGYMLTNHHVVHNGNTPNKNIYITTGDKKIKCLARIIDTDKKSDVTLLSLVNCNTKTPYIPMISKFSTVRPGDSVMIIGNALDFGLAPVTGTVKFPKSQDVDEDLLYSALTNCGDSGSPLINASGVFIGVNKASLYRSGDTEVQGIAVATNGDRVKSLLEQWRVRHGITF